MRLQGLRRGGFRMLLSAVRKGGYSDVPSKVSVLGECAPVVRTTHPNNTCLHSMANERLLLRRHVSTAPRFCISNECCWTCL